MPVLFQATCRKGYHWDAYDKKLTKTQHLSKKITYDSVELIDSSERFVYHMVFFFLTLSMYLLCISDASSDLENAYTNNCYHTYNDLPSINPSLSVLFLKSASKIKHKYINM